MTRLTAFAWMVAVALASPSGAQVSPQVAVDYADLDLTTTEGQATLRHRLDEAVVETCPVAGHEDPGDVLEWHQCRLNAEIESRGQMAAIVRHALRVAERTDKTRLAAR